MDIPSYRQKHKLTQAQFAALLRDRGIKANQSLVSMWERSPRRMPAERVVEVAAAFPEITRQAIRPDLWGSEQAQDPLSPADSQRAA